MWRYREALPIDHDENIVSFHEGFTPLVTETIFGKKVLLKLDYLFPSGSFKDRGASVLVSKMKELGIRSVVEDSSGNAGAAIAAYCAKAGIQCNIYVPEKTSSEKFIQIQSYGATLHKIHGTREATARAALLDAQSMYYASHYWNPYFIHGTKTFIFEVVEQLDWRAPDIVMVPVGNGTLLLGIYQGLLDLQRKHHIETLPRLIGVQTAHCAPLAYAWKKHKFADKNQLWKKSIAEGIAITKPIRATDILHAVKCTKGDIITVNEREIINALHMIQHKGYYIEPTSAVALAGLQKYTIKNNEVIIVPLTGHGLKQSYL